MSVLGTLGIAYRAHLCFLGDELIDGIRKQKVSLVIIASDCGKASYKKLTDKCSSFSVPYVIAYTKEELSHALGRGSISSIGVTDEKLAKKLMVELKQ